jgi:hypothetical protein
MPLSSLLFLGLVASALGQVLLLVDLIGAHVWLDSSALWLAVHAAMSLAAGFCAGRLLGLDRSKAGLFILLVGFSLLIPVIGTLGGYTSLALGMRAARQRRREPDYWSVTRRAELPFTTPSGRQPTSIDSRGFTEHLMYSQDDQALYRKVLAAGNMRASLSITAFRQGMRHKDERIRLIAYKTLDRKVSKLNTQIQQLEQRVAGCGSREGSNTWLQIASSYWELLTLEQAEPVARRQLLDKASAAATQAVAAWPLNRNAHFVLGRISLMQNDTRRADVAFTRARALGMPTDKVVPYLAESAFIRHDFSRVRDLVQQLDPAIRAYPPLAQVSEYWL